MIDGCPGALLLDLDDTILASGAVSRAAWLEACDAHNGALPDGITPAALVAAIEGFATWYWDDPVRHRNARLRIVPAQREIVEGALRALGARSPKLARRVGDAYLEERRRAIQPFPGALESLAALGEAGVRMALVTNGDSETQREKLGRFDIGRYFDYVLIEGEFGAGKPDPSVYLHALERIGGTPSDAWMVGDNLEWEVAAPQRLGIVGIWHDWRGNGLPSGSAVRPDRIITSLTELAQGS